MNIEDKNLENSVEFLNENDYTAQTPVVTASSVKPTPKADEKINGNNKNVTYGDTKVETTTQTLKGVRFTLKKDDKVISSSLITDKDGIITLKDLADGNYTLYEVSVPKYKLAIGKTEESTDNSRIITYNSGFKTGKFDFAVKDGKLEIEGSTVHNNTADIYNFRKIKKITWKEKAPKPNKPHKPNKPPTTSVPSTPIELFTPSSVPPAPKYDVPVIKVPRNVMAKVTKKRDPSLDLDGDLIPNGNADVASGKDPTPNGDSDINFNDGSISSGGLALTGGLKINFVWAVGMLILLLVSFAVTEVIKIKSENDK